MINGIGETKAGGRIGPAGIGLERATATAKTGDRQLQDQVGTPVSPTSLMAASGPPVDMDKVAAIRAAIAEGRYPVDAGKIAERMIALDLGDA
jgi:negative regulator of flagellin synthesis FlgM